MTSEFLKTLKESPIRLPHHQPPCSLGAVSSTRSCLTSLANSCYTVAKITFCGYIGSTACNLAKSSLGCLAITVGKEHIPKAIAPLAAWIADDFQTAQCSYAKGWFSLLVPMTVVAITAGASIFLAKTCYKTVTRS